MTMSKKTPAAPVANQEQYSVLDDHFARLMMSLAVKPSAVLERTARRVSQATRERNVCIDIEQGQKGALTGSGVIGSPEDPGKPMILDAHGRLYLNRYWEYEQTIARTILERIDGTVPLVQKGKVAKRLDDYFPKKDAAKNQHQREAAEYALQHTMCIISGGPGTGKTTTVAVILALLIEFSEKENLHIALAAPTGKAAARLQESIISQKQRLPIPADVKLKIPEDAGTMHRLLRSKRGTPYFRHDNAHPLAADVVVLDECSMIDAALMAKFMDAVGPQTRLILLGDKDQLSSVEAGAVFSDLCGAALPCVKQLTYSHRFGDASGIGALSRSINEGDADAAIGKFTEGFTDIGLSSFATVSEYETALAARIIGGYREYFQATTIAEAFARLSKFRILCAVREGEYGANGINRFAEEVLKREGMIDRKGDIWYKGCAVMITENDYGLSLFNGDTGIVWPDDEENGALAVCFDGGETGLRKFNPSSLPAHDVVYAMTVHKSQGSQFGRVLTVLPQTESQVVTRELLYTAVTRAETEAHIWAPEAIVREAVVKRTVRHSGLTDALVR
jgi:exodeoxyribonuclease V alpha subunit